MQLNVSIFLVQENTKTSHFPLYADTVPLKIRVAGVKLMVKSSVSEQHIFFDSLECGPGIVRSGINHNN